MRTSTSGSGIPTDPTFFSPRTGFGATAESWNAGTRKCNRFKYLFEDVKVAVTVHVGTVVAEVVEVFALCYAAVAELFVVILQQVKRQGFAFFAL